MDLGVTKIVRKSFVKPFIPNRGASASLTLGSSGWRVQHKAAGLLQEDQCRLREFGSRSKPLFDIKVLTRILGSANPQTGFLVPIRILPLLQSALYHFLSTGRLDLEVTDRRNMSGQMEGHFHNGQPWQPYRPSDRISIPPHLLYVQTNSSASIWGADVTEDGHGPCL